MTIPVILGGSLCSALLLPDGMFCGRCRRVWPQPAGAFSMLSGHLIIQASEA